MKVSTKILAGFVVIALIGLALGVTGLLSVRTLTDMTGDLERMQATSRNVNNVLNAHYVWRGGLTEAVLKGDPAAFTGSLNPDGCAFGTWLQTPEARSITDTEVLALLEQVNEPHRFIHNEAANVLQLMESGAIDEAETMLQETILPRVEQVTSLLGQVVERYTVLSDRHGKP